MSEKSKGQKLQEKLAYKKKNYYEVASKEEKKEIFASCSAWVRKIWKRTASV